MNHSNRFVLSSFGLFLPVETTDFRFQQKNRTLIDLVGQISARQAFLRQAISP
jgi:hypothetical protein